SREQHVARADRGNRLHVWGIGAEQHAPPFLAEERQAGGLGGDQDVPGTHVGDPFEGADVILVIAEFMPDQRLGFALVRRHEERLRIDPEPPRLSLGDERSLEFAKDLRADWLAIYT